MQRAWRLVQRRHIARALEGVGARMHGGRWNSPGTAIVYAADSRALAALEVLAGTRRTDVFEEYALLGFGFPDSVVSTIPRASLPSGWRTVPATPASQRIGDTWANEMRSAVIRVPSAIIPAEFNLLLNPAHPDFGAVTIEDPEDFDFDPRLG